jgi:hypothetical protein
MLPWRENMQNDWGFRVNDQRVTAISQQFSNPNTCFNSLEAKEKKVEWLQFVIEMRETLGSDIFFIR